MCANWGGCCRELLLIRLVHCVAGRQTPLIMLGEGTWDFTTGERAEFKELELVMESGGLHEVLSSELNGASTFSDDDVKRKHGGGP